MRSFDSIYVNELDIIRLAKKYKIDTILPIGQEIDLGLKQGEFPVWVYWGQGEENTPEIVKMCIKTIKKNLPSNAKLFILDENNINNYITLPTYILNKVGQNYTHLSDIIRAALLYLYGGMWLDATYYILSPIPQEIFEKDFWAVKEDCSSEQGFEIPTGFKPFTWNLIYCKEPGNQLVLTVYSLMCNYWLHNNYLKHYYLKDGAILYGYNNDLYSKRLILNLEFSNPNIYAFINDLNNIYSEDEYQEKIENTIFFKLTYKNPVKENINGNLTYYGYLKSLIGGQINE